MIDQASAAPPASIPAAPLVLGLAGLIPFWGLAVASLLHSAFGLDPTAVDLALATYAAIIVSFLGGIRWGLATGGQGEATHGEATHGKAAHYAVAVVPSLVAWAALAAPEPWRLAILGLVALALGPIDLDLVRAGLAPSWFGRLRLILSTGAGVALLLAAWG